MQSTVAMQHFCTRGEGNCFFPVNEEKEKEEDKEVEEDSKDQEEEEEQEEEKDITTRMRYFAFQ